MNTSAIVLAWPMLSIIVDKSYAPSTIMVALIVIHNCAVLGLSIPSLTGEGIFIHITKHIACHIYI